MRADKLAALISRLYVRTARKRGEQIELDLAIDTYLGDLSKYPADIVHDAVEGWPETNKFWPTWCDLFESIGWRTEQREVILKALHQPPKMKMHREEPERESLESREACVKEVMERLNPGAEFKD